VYIYRTGIEFLDFGYAATLSVALFAVGGWFAYVQPLPG
jgi:ABC-type sugar transport system permease subunit